MSFDAPKLAENISAFINHVIGLKPAAVKGQYLKGIVVSRNDEPQRANPSVEKSVMSKYVKNLVAEHLRRQLAGVHECAVGKHGRAERKRQHTAPSGAARQDIQVLVVKNSLAARAAEGTALAPMFDGVAGTSAICWGSEDIVSLAKEITKLIQGDKFAPFQARGGVMDGERLTAVQVDQVSKWPSRTEQLSILSGQILSPGTCWRAS